MNTAAGLTKKQLLDVLESVPQRYWPPRPTRQDRAVLVERIHAAAVGPAGEAVRVAIAAQELHAAAVEIANDDPTFRSPSFDDFLAVMWHTDDDMKRHDLDRTAFRTALHRAWERFRR